MSEAKADCNLAGTAELQWGRSGIFDMISCIDIDLLQDILCFLLAILRDQSLHQKPCGRR